MMVQNRELLFITSLQAFRDMFVHDGAIKVKIQFDLVNTLAIIYSADLCPTSVMVYAPQIDKSAAPIHL